MNSINDTILWIFIGIGFAGALGLTTAAIFNL
jgi:hypothetical protein